jgi:hypothetical protein
MSRLYVANTTAHNQLFYYRLDFNVDGNPDLTMRLRMPNRQDIPSGTQLPIGRKDLHISQVNEIISQLELMGAVAVADVRRSKAFIPYVYSVDKPASQVSLDFVVAHNKGEKWKEGEIRRAQAAVAANDILARTVEELPVKFEVEIEQLETPPGEKTIAEGFRVDNHPNPNAPPPSARARARKAA